MTLRPLAALGATDFTERYLIEQAAQIKARGFELINKLRMARSRRPLQHFMRFGRSPADRQSFLLSSRLQMLTYFAVALEANSDSHEPDGVDLDFAIENLFDLDVFDGLKVLEVY